VETDTAITVVDVTTRSRRTLLPLDYGSVEAAFWSSDGSQVLVEVELYAGCGPRRFLLAADGTSRQRLRLPVAGYLLDWPPEAQRVLVLAAKRECSDRYTMPFGAGEPPPPGALVSLALDGSNRVVLARNVAHAGNAAIASAAWSPDAKTVASTRCRHLPGNQISCSLWKTRAGAKSQLLIPEGAVTVGDAEVFWTAEGEIVSGLVSYRSGQSGAVVAVDPATRRVRRVVDGVDYPWILSVSSDSRRVAFLDSGRLVVADLRSSRRSQYQAPKMPPLTESQTIAVWLR
jgi:hypothetical protein